MGGKNYGSYGSSKLSLTGMDTVSNEYKQLCGNFWNGNDCEGSLPRIVEYCNMNTPVGDEFSIQSQTDDYELVHLLVTIRHGDRTTLNRIPGSYKTTISNSDKFLLLEPQVKKYTSTVKNIVLKYLMSDSEEKPVSIIKTRYNPLNQVNLFTKSDYGLISGELTSRGFWQHHQLGDHLNRAYQPFLSKIKESNHIYVRSTNYNRTIQSAAAFIGALLPDFTAEVHLKVFDQDSDEVMHGVGQRLSSKPPPPGSKAVTATNHSGEIVSEGSCKKSVKLAKTQRAAIYNNPSFDRQISELFVPEAAQLPVTDLADASMPSICHKKPLPCSATGCLSIDLLREAMRESDRLYCLRYSGKHGGKQANNLAMYPFMHELVSKLRRAAGTPASDPLSPLLTIFSGHDTVIAPTLAALGVYDRRSFLCRWPSYASRIVFELYRKKNKSSAVSGSDEHFVRILFNGLDIGSLIPSCESSYVNISQVDSTTRNIRSGHESRSFKQSSADRRQAGFPWVLCPLSSIVHQVELMITPFTTSYEACQLKDD